MKLLHLSLIIFLVASQAFAGKMFVGQTQVRETSGAQTASTLFEVNSTTRASIPAPKMTATQRDAISSPAAGFMIFNTTTNAFNVYNGTAWVAVGSSTGGINYVTGGDAEGGTTGWATYADAAQATPVDCTAGSPTVTWTTTSSSPLRDNNSFLYTRDAANRQGQGASYAFTIASVDQAKVLTIAFDYGVASGTWQPGSSTQDSDVEPYIYDVTNAVIIQPAGYKLTGGSTGAFKYSGTFQTASNSTSYRLCLHTATTAASALTVKFDSVSVGPGSPGTIGSIVTDEVAWTPTFTGFGTVSAVTATSKRVGDRLAVRGVFTAGTTTATQARISIGFNGADGNVTTAAAIPAAGQICGWWADNTVNISGSILCTPSVAYVTLSLIDATHDGYTAQNGSTLISAAGKLAFGFEVPITGWGSSVTMSNDTDTRVVAAIVSGDPASATVGNPIIVPTVIYDSHGAYNNATGRYTVPVPGVYKVFGALQSASAATTLTIYKNAVSTSLAGNLDSNGEATFASAVNCIAGDIIDLRPGGTVDATTMTLNFERVSGPATIAATETVAARYTNTAGSTLTKSADNVVPFATKDYDTHSAFVTDTFTAPISGKYEACAGIVIATGATWAAADVFLLAIQKNGTDSSVNAMYQQASHTTGVGNTICASLNLVAGDTIKVNAHPTKAAASNVTLNTTAGYNWLAIKRIGN